MAKTDDPDFEWVRALQNGDDAALNELMARHRLPLVRFLHRYTRSAAVAEDLAQETFVRAYFHIGDFKPSARFSTWLYRIGVNLARDYARSKQFKRALRNEPIPESGTAWELPDTASLPSDQARAAEELKCVYRLIHELPHPLKSAFLLTVIEERSQKEVAEILGITPKAVETRVYRARSLLSEQFGRECCP